MSKVKRLGFLRTKCEICQLVFYVKNTYFKNRNRRFCSAQCRNVFFARMPVVKECILCKKPFKDKTGGDRVYCSLNCYWANLKKIHPRGDKKSYLKVKINGKRLSEHRYLIEKSIGRKLLRSEIVHHLNGDKHDNRLENLKIITQSEHIKEHFKKISFGKIKE